MKVKVDDLKPGSYRLVMQAIDSAKNHSPDRAVDFGIAEGRFFPSAESFPPPLLGGGRLLGPFRCREWDGHGKEKWRQATALHLDTSKSFPTCIFGRSRVSTRRPHFRNFLAEEGLI